MSGADDILRMEASKTFLDLYDAYNIGGKHPRVIVLVGGSRSGKTWALMQLLLIIGSREEMRRITIWRLKRTWVKPTVYGDFIGLLKKYDLYNKKNLNETELRYKLYNSTFEFGGLDDSQKLHGLTTDFNWINEAIEAGKDDFDQLEMRCSGTMFLDCNPSEEESWVYDLDKRDDVIFLHSTHLNNAFLPVEVRRKILGYEPTPANIALGTADTYKWSVYGLGLPAKREGLIFKDYNIIQEWGDDIKFIGIGLDFGFYPDPTAAIRVGLLNGKLVLDELFYENHLVTAENNDLASIEGRLKDNGIRPHMQIIADNSAQAAIMELENKNFNIKATTKYPGSVVDGLELMQRYAPFYVTARSLNMIKELKNYTRKKDFASGKFLKEPIDAYNHLIDAARYVVLDFISKKKANGIQRATL